MLCQVYAFSLDGFSNSVRSPVLSLPTSSDWYWKCFTFNQTSGVRPGLYSPPPPPPKEQVCLAVYSDGSPELCGEPGGGVSWQHAGHGGLPAPTSPPQAVPAIPPLLPGQQIRQASRPYTLHTYTHAYYKAFGQNFQPFCFFCR